MTPLTASPLDIYFSELTLILSQRDCKVRECVWVECWCLLCLPTYCWFISASPSQGWQNPRGFSRQWCSTIPSNKFTGNSRLWMYCSCVQHFYLDFVLLYFSFLPFFQQASKFHSLIVSTKALRINPCINILLLWHKKKKVIVCHIYVTVQWNYFLGIDHLVSKLWSERRSSHDTVLLEKRGLQALLGGPAVAAWQWQLSDQ